jgi:hypothetical protein
MEAQGYNIETFSVEESDVCSEALEALRKHPPEDGIPSLLTRGRERLKPDVADADTESTKPRSGATVAVPTEALKRIVVTFVVTFVVSAVTAAEAYALVVRVLS